jgi:antitoxin (DNA-binding transcriptional repressor) of toxin-antitoxin stability system
MRSTRNQRNRGRAHRVLETTASRITAADARETLPEVLLKISKGERIVLRRLGRDLAALVPMEDLELIERLEDAVDIARAESALAERGNPIPYERLRRDLRIGRRRHGTGRSIARKQR